MLVDEGFRKKVEIGGEYFYLYVSKEAVFCTVPRENDPQMSKTRMIVETLCSEINSIREKENEE